ncbi:MAG: hypothetical protein LBH31_00620 [Burkholderiaceae bacterium]|jgi:hypothetical protein|nr:hypothetical protein [Burkholderiaceae bacterium]
MILQRLQETGMGVALAASLGVSESTISRIKNDQLANVLALVYAAGFKVVPQCQECADADEIQMLRRFYAHAVLEKMAEQQAHTGAGGAE